MALVTLSTLISRLTALMGDNSVFWSRDEKVDAINEALFLWQALTGELKEVAWELSATAGEHFYTLPRQILSPTRVSFRMTQSSSWTPLALTSLPELDNGFVGWEDDMTQTAPLYWFPVGISEIGLFPSPSLSFGTVEAVLRVEGYSENPGLYSDGDFLNLGEEETVPILNYAHHYLTFKEAGAELNSSSEELKALFTAAVERNDVLTTTQFYRRTLGLVKEESERPEREGMKTFGVRGRQGAI